MNADSQKCTVYISQDTHNHSVENDEQHLQENVKKAIIEIYEQGIIYPNGIIDQLYSRRLIATKIQISNLLFRYKTQKFGSRNMTLNELKEWCLKYSSIPENPDEVFVGNTYFLPGPESVLQLRIFLTTKRLLESALKSDHMNLDATYKLLWQGFPVILAGTTDQGRHFHPFGLTICKTEQQDDYGFTCVTIKNLIREIFNVEYSPSTLVADAAPSITNGFNQAFFCRNRVICWAHVIRNVDKRLKHIKDAINEEMIRRDIVNIQITCIFVQMNEN